MAVHPSPTDLSCHLFCAARYGEVSKVHNLLRSGADPSWRDAGVYNRTPLHMAAMNGHPKCVHALLNASSDPLATDTLGYNALDLSLLALHGRQWRWTVKRRKACIDLLQIAYLRAQPKCAEVFVVFHPDGEIGLISPITVTNQSDQ